MTHFFQLTMTKSVACAAIYPGFVKQLKGILKGEGNSNFKGVVVDKAKYYNEASQ